MSSYRKLLAIVSPGTTASPAAAMATALAQRGRSQLVLRAFVGGKSDAADARSWIAATVTQLRQQGVDASGEVAAGGDTLESMVAEIHAVGPDLVVKELHHESALRRLFMTPVDWNLARQSPVPLLGVAPSSTGLPLNVVAAVDIHQADPDAHLTDRVLEQAKRIALAAGAELHLAHVYEPIVETPEDPSMMLAASPPMLMDELRQIHEARFAEIAAGHGVPASRQHLVIGRVDASLEDLCAKIGAQLIVTGGSSAHGIERLVVGSTSEELMAHARQSVLMVQPEAVTG